jgi:CrcB protein
MRQLIAVVAGALIGTGLRLALDLTLPFATVAINIIGSFALGYLAARLWPTAPDWLRAGLGPGLLGSFTTFSAFAVSVVSLIEAGEWMSALAYLAVTILGGLIAAWAGLRLGSRRAPATGSPS